jgi:hypothetical protein
MAGLAFDTLSPGSPAFPGERVLEKRHEEF